MFKGVKTILHIKFKYQENFKILEELKREKKIILIDEVLDVFIKILIVEYYSMN